MWNDLFYFSADAAKIVDASRSTICEGPAWCGITVRAVNNGIHIEEPYLYTLVVHVVLMYTLAAYTVK